MTPAESRVDAGIWSVPGHAAVIEYSRTVIGEILLQVMDAYETYFAGGYEIGGVLYGERSGAGRVRILAHRSLDINPPRPSFVLSKKDERTLKKLIELPASDPDLAGMEPVGWYHSHTRSEVFLSESDLEIFDTWFPEAWQVALLFRPNEGEPVRAGFFFRESDGFIRADQSYQEISFDPPDRSPLRRARPPWAIADSGEPVEPAVPAGIEPEIIEQAPPPPEAEVPTVVAGEAVPDQPSSGRRYGLWAAGLMLVIGSAALTVPYWAELFSPPGQAGLDVIQREGDLNIRWNPSAPVLADVESATLFIIDGSRRVDRPLSREQLRRGYETYRPLGSRVDVRLQIQRSWHSSRQEIATYLAHPDRGKPTPELLEARKEVLDADTEVNRLRNDLVTQWQHSEYLQQRVADLDKRQQEIVRANQERRRIQLKNTPKELPTAPEVASRPVMAAAQPPPRQESPIRPPVEAPKPATVAPPPQSVQPVPVPVAPQPAVRPAAPPPSAIPAIPLPRTAPASGPSSGRFLWTGNLRRNASLTIDGRSASTGSVTGELPGGTVRLAAYPAELTANEMRVYTPNPRFAAEPRVEAPSAGNGWNRTIYTYDQRTLRDLIVEQPPSAGAPKKLVLRAGSRGVSVILIEWQVIAP